MQPIIKAMLITSDGIKRPVRLIPSSNISPSIREESSTQSTARFHDESMKKGIISTDYKGHQTGGPAKGCGTEREASRSVCAYLGEEQHQQQHRAIRRHWQYKEGD